MRRLKIVTTLLFAIAFSLSACEAGDTSLTGLVQAHAKGTLAQMKASAPGRTAPNIPFTSREGQKTVKDFAGRVVVLNLWATWCAPCIKELPSLDRLQGAFNVKDVSVVVVAQDTAGWAVVDRKWPKLGMRNIDTYLDDDIMLTNTFRAPSLPLTIVYDRKGREVARMMRPAEWDAPEAKAFLQAVAALK
jgi:thiol-disulfide isomerase/thioredoxin